MIYKILLLVITLYPATVFSFQNEPEGFRGFKWEDDFLLHESKLTLIEEGDLSKVYLKKDDQLKIGGAELTKVTYFFDNNKFSNVLIKCDGSANVSALIDAFKSQFGSPDTPNKYIKNYYWRGPVTTIMLICSDIKRQCTGIIQSSKLAELRMIKKREDAKKASNDF